MWKSVVGHKSSDKVLRENINNSNEEEAWDTDPDFVNTVSEKEQRWGSKTIEGSGRLDSINIVQLREEVKKDDEQQKQKEYEESSIKYSLGYGGKFGVQHDRLDKSAVGFEYQNQNEKHVSQLNYTKTSATNETIVKNSINLVEEKSDEIIDQQDLKPKKLDFKSLKSRFENK